MRDRENRYLTGNFAPVHEEVTAVDLPVTGTIPEPARRPLPAQRAEPGAPLDPATYHWFTGDGMVHGVRLRDGKAEWYRNRWVRGERCDRRARRAATRRRASTAAWTSARTRTSSATPAARSRSSRPAPAGRADLRARHRRPRATSTARCPDGFTAHPKRDPADRRAARGRRTSGARATSAVHRRRHRRPGPQGRRRSR